MMQMLVNALGNTGVGSSKAHAGIWVGQVVWQGKVKGLTARECVTRKEENQGAQPAQFVETMLTASRTHRTNHKRQTEDGKWGCQLEDGNGTLHVVGAPSCWPWRGSGTIFTDDLAGVPRILDRLVRPLEV